MSRAFPTTAPNITSSDRSKMLKQQTIYNNIRDNITKNVCQKKANKFGSVNYCLSNNRVTDPNAPGSNDYYSFVSGTIRSVDGYETLYDISKGKAYCNPCNILLNEFDGTAGQSSNTLYINPDDVIIADTAKNYCIGKGLPCCGGASPSDALTCSRCDGGVGMIFKTNNIGVLDPNNAVGFMSRKCFTCDSVCEPTSVIIDPSHNTFRTGCKSSFTTADKPGPWVDRIKIANPTVMSRFAVNSYRRRLAGFSLLNPISIAAYPKDTVSLQNCDRYPQYNGIYLLDQDKYIVGATSNPVSSVNPSGPNDLVYSQWVQIDANGNMTGRTIIPCIGSSVAGSGGVGAGFPCVFSYVISTTDLRNINQPFPGGVGQGENWTVFTTYNTFFENAPIGSLPGTLAPMTAANEFYVTNAFQYDASGFTPFVIQTPNLESSGNDKNLPAVSGSWNKTGISKLLVDQPTQNTFSAQYPDYADWSVGFAVPINEDRITIKTVS